jgi:hypothetical protein
MFVRYANVVGSASNPVLASSSVRRSADGASVCKSSQDGLYKPVL